MKNTFISHTIHAELQEDEFNDKWRKVKSALCNLALAISQEFHDAIVNEIEKLYKENPLRWTTIENTRILIEDHIADTTFQTTSIVGKGLDILASKGIVIYTGFSGCGKTKVAMETMIKARDFDIPNTDVTLLYLEQLENLTTIIDPWKQNIVLLDDCFGKSSVTKGALKDKMLAINIIYCLVKTGRTKVIFTLRTKILKDCTARLRETKLFHENFENIILDLNCLDLKYTMEDKRIILEKHLLGRNVKITLTKTQIKDVDWENTGWIDQFSVDSISRIERHDFPLQCRLFCSQLKNLKRGENYFRRSQVSCIEDLDEMKRSDYLVDRFRYCVLAYACLKDGVFDMSVLDRSLFFKLQQNIMHSVLPNKEISSEIHNALRNLSHTYLQKRVDKDYVWSFWHNSILEAAAVSTSESFPELVIAHCNSIVLMELLVPDDVEGCEEDFVIPVLPEMYENVCQRFLLEMRNDPQSISSLLRHRLMENKEFNDFFASYLVSNLTPFSHIDLKEDRIEREHESSLIREVFLVACRIDHSDVVTAILKLGDLQQMLINKGFTDSCYFNCPSVAGILQRLCTNFTESFHQACSFGSTSALRKIAIDTSSCFLSVDMPANDEMFSQLQKAVDLPEEFLTAFSKTKHLLAVIINIQTDLNPFPYHRNYLFMSFVGSIIKCIQENQCIPAGKFAETILHSSSLNMLSILAFSIVRMYIDCKGKPQGLENEEYLLLYDSLRDAVAFLRSNDSYLEHTCSSAFGKRVGLCSDQELREICLACATCETIQHIFRQIYSCDGVSLPVGVRGFQPIFEVNRTFCTKSVVDYMKCFVKFAVDNALELRKLDNKEKGAYQALLSWTVWGYPFPYVLEIDKATGRNKYCKYKDEDALFLPFESLKEGLYRSCKAGHEEITTALIQLLLQRHSFECDGVLRRAITDTIDVGKYDFAAKITNEHREHLSKEDISRICYHFEYENQLEKAKMVSDLYKSSH
ncbi:hypothetical protein FSP39_023127 [Pinctada imbricata]|uniref:Novel STAND NTPase 3 domain-containing protein n=1 Tax=Pinctada imbricata TaxID=66713 RepID=A0AA88XGD3_PINIB|nr:hypothetical protein FSP39_023127 [Pinctada imbricata]